jgi:predicted lipid-binding transport protein (Tim44 family)
MRDEVAYIKERKWLCRHASSKGNRMNSAFDPLNMILLVIAAVVAWRLWSVLGTRTGLEKPPIVLTPNTPPPRAENSNAPLDGEVLPPESQKPVWSGYAPEGSPLAQGLEAIAAKSQGFTVRSFIAGASAAYEMVLEAFAKGDKQALKALLSKELLDSFSSEIDKRNAQGHSMKFQFVGVKSTDMKRAALVGNKAQVEIGFVSEMISATMDKSAAVVDGDDQAIRTVSDLWTFERDVTSRDPNWKLVATDDND